MNRIVFAVIGAVVGVLAADFLYQIFTSSEWFVQLMSPIPLYLGLAFVVVAFIVGFVRMQFSGLTMIALWFCAVFVNFVAQDSSPEGSDRMNELSLQILRWLFVITSAISVVINATTHGTSGKRAP